MFYWWPRGILLWFIADSVGCLNDCVRRLVRAGHGRMALRWESRQGGCAGHSLSRAAAEG